MFYLVSKDGEGLTPEKISDIIKKFETNDKVKLNKYMNYYLGNQVIMQKTVSDPTRPCNKVVSNYCSTITNNYLGYLTGIDITYSSDQDFSAIQDVLNYNDVASIDSELLRNALIFGKAFEICFINEEGKQRFKVLDSRECIPVYSNSLDEDLVAVIRYFPVDGTDLTKGYSVEVYEENGTRYFTMNSMFSSLGFVDEKPNFYKQVPITVFRLNQEEKSIFDNVMSLQDAYNKLLSSEVDDWEAFCDSYLVLTGVDTDEETIQKMKEDRVLIMPSDSQAEYLTKNVSDTQIENMLDNINTMIHKVANSPDFSDENFGASSGIALRYRLLGFENTAGAIEKNMTKALQRRIELICSILNLTGNESMWRDVQIIFTRNLPVDMNDVVNTVNNLRGLVSDKTLLTQVPFVQDIDAEIQNIEEERTSKMSLYGFPTNTSDENEDEEV